MFCCSAESVCQYIISLVVCRRKADLVTRSVVFRKGGAHGSASSHGCCVTSTNTGPSLDWSASRCTAHLPYLNWRCLWPACHNGPSVVLKYSGHDSQPRKAVEVLWSPPLCATHLFLYSDWHHSRVRKAACLSLAVILQVMHTGRPQVLIWGAVHH